MVTQELIDYIKQVSESGTSKEDIKNNLLQNGWTEVDINEAFGAIEKNSIMPKSFKENIFSALGVSFITVALIIILGYIDSYITSNFHPFHGLSKIAATLAAYVFCVLILIVAPILFGRKKGWRAEFLFVIFELLWIVITVALGFYFFPPDPTSRTGLPEKPIIYLYPQQKADVYVELDYVGEIIADYPEYNKAINGWSLTAYPDGHLINKADGKEYNYLFWEGSALPIDWDMTKGFVVEGKNTREFLQNTLSKMGLTPKEYNEFIVYWYPRMKNNKYNLITFADKQYIKNAPLIITPKPDSMLRVFMVFKPLNEEIKIEPQEIKPFKRSGFTVVEWGGTELK